MHKKETETTTQTWLGIHRNAAFFLLFWFLLNILQVSLTELTSDEGYYWFYAQHLQWGYYDHPPMIAAMIKAGSFLFPGELGVRFFNVVFSTAGLYLFFRLLPAHYQDRRTTLFVLLSAPLLHYLTFLVFPDGPLLFFSLLFLFAYKRFLEKESAGNALLMGIALAFMAYAKYHGGLVLLLTVLSNPKLLRSAYFYLALVVAAVFFLPHIWWQYSNDFPTLKYHLSGRTGNWSFRYVGEYLSQQLVAIGPGLIFIPFVAGTKSVFERTLKFIAIGTFAFFLFSSFKTFVHFHWTSIALFPLLYLAVQWYHDSKRKKLINRLLIPFVVLFLVVRILLMIPFIPNMHVGEDYYHGRKQWSTEIATLAGEKPVFMPNNLREASLYAFYSGKQSVTLYNRPEKKSQYELWGYEDSLQGREVLFVTKYPVSGSESFFNTLQQNLFQQTISSFHSFYNGIEIIPSITRQTGDSIEVALEIKNHRTRPLSFDSGLNSQRVGLAYSVENEKEIIATGVIRDLEGTLPVGGTQGQRGKVLIRELKQGDYRLFFGIRNGTLPDAILSKGIKFSK